jgi:hypothetical protein
MKEGGSPPCLLFTAYRLLFLIYCQSGEKKPRGE